MKRKALALVFTALTALPWLQEMPQTHMPSQWCEDHQGQVCSLSPDEPIRCRWHNLVWGHCACQEGTWQCAEGNP